MKNKSLSLKKEFDILSDGHGQSKLKLKQAVEIANIARKVISDKKLYCEIKGNKYVYTQGWKLIANLLGLVPTIDIDKTKIQTEIKTLKNSEGKEYIVELIKVYAVAYLKDRDGKEHGTAIGMCSSLEKNWYGRDETAILGMAQTRAIGRACKNALDWLITLAGYSDVPYEEITNNSEPHKEQEQEKIDIEINGEN